MRVFQTFILPDDLVARYRLSFAAANFSRNLIAGGGFDQVYSLIQVGLSGEFDSINEEEYEVVTSNWRKKGRLRSKFAIFLEQWAIFKKIKGASSVWFYNINTINSFLFVLLKLFRRRVRLNVIVLDFTPVTNWRKLNYWYLKLINSADGLICLSYSELFKVKNAVVMPGVTPIEDVDFPCIEKPSRDFLLSGVLSETISMTSSVLEAFSNMPDCKLYITGKVMDDEQLILDYASKFPNIIYLGSIPFKNYLELVHKVTFQLSTRNPDMPENQCNFPSKIIEALLHNRIVVSTIEYPQLKNLKYMHIDSNNIRESLSRIVQMSDADLLDFANQGKSTFALFNANEWNKQIEIIENNESYGRRNA